MAEEEAGFPNFVDYAFVQRTVQLWGSRLDPVSRVRRKGHRLFDAADPGKTQARAGRGNAAALGHGGRPLGRPPLVRRTLEQLAAGTEARFSRCRPPRWANSSPSSENTSCLISRTARANPGAIRRPTKTGGYRSFYRACFTKEDAFHTLALPHKTLLGIPRKPDRVLRGRLDDHGGS